MTVMTPSQYNLDALLHVFERVIFCYELKCFSTGGSLFNLLDDPENNFGLDEDEWLLVLSHLSAGMNHLRDNNLVHRFAECPTRGTAHLAEIERFYVFYLTGI